MLKTPIWSSDEMNVISLKHRQPMIWKIRLIPPYARLHHFLQHSVFSRLSVNCRPCQNFSPLTRGLSLLQRIDTYGSIFGLESLLMTWLKLNNSFLAYIDTKTAKIVTICTDETSFFDTFSSGQSVGLGIERSRVRKSPVPSGFLWGKKISRHC